MASHHFVDSELERRIKTKIILQFCALPLLHHIVTQLAELCYASSAVSKLGGEEYGSSKPRGTEAP